MHTVVSLEVALALEFLVRFCVVNEVQPVNNNNKNNNNNSNSNSSSNNNNHDHNHDHNNDNNNDRKQPSDHKSDGEHDADKEGAQLSPLCASESMHVYGSTGSPPLC